MFEDPSTLQNYLQSYRKNKKIVFTNGCFDLLHVGHVRYLKEARALGDSLIVAVNSDQSVRKLKGEGRPVQTQKDRAEILAALGCVDFVTIFSRETPYEVIELLKPDILVKGGDWPVEKIVGYDLVTRHGGRVCSLAFHQGRSTSSLIQQILKA